MTKKNLEIKLKMDFDYDEYLYDILDRYIGKLGDLHTWEVKNFVEYKEDVTKVAFEPVTDVITMFEEILSKCELKKDKDFIIPEKILDFEDPTSPVLIIQIINRKLFFQKLIDINNAIKKRDFSYVRINCFTIGDFIDKDKLLDALFVMLSDCYDEKEGFFQCAFRSDMLEKIGNQLESISGDERDWIHDEPDIFDFIWSICIKLQNFGYIGKTESDSQVEVLINTVDIDHTNYITKAPKKDGTLCPI